MKNLEQMQSFSLENKNLQEMQGGSIWSAIWRALGNASLAYDIGEALVDAHQYMHKNFGNPSELRGLK